MKKFDLPVTWEVWDKVQIEAETIEDAIQIFEATKDEIPLGTEPEYIEGSFRIDDGENGQSDIESTVRHLKEFWDLSGGITGFEIDDFPMESDVKPWHSDVISKIRDGNTTKNVKVIYEIQKQGKEMIAYREYLPNGELEQIEHLTSKEKLLPLEISKREKTALPIFITELPQVVKETLKEKIYEIFDTEGHATAVINNVFDSKIVDVLAVFQNDLEVYDEKLCNEVVELLNKAKNEPTTYMVETFETSEGATGEIATQSVLYDITPFLDDAEDECFKLFKAYASVIGVEFDEEEIDFRIAKEISENIINVLENTFGQKFPTSSNELDEETSDMEYDR